MTACGDQAHPLFQSLNISANKAFTSKFSLLDSLDKPITLAAYKGRVVAIFFGYIHCPDVCPTTLAEMNQVIHKLGDDAKKIQVIFVTVDPERDTPELLSEYVHAFNPDFLGLRAIDEVAFEKMKRDFRVVVEKVEGKTPDSYTIDHTAGIYVFDQKGQLRILMRPDQTVDQMVEDLKKLL